MIPAWIINEIEEDKKKKQKQEERPVIHLPEDNGYEREKTK